MTSEENFDSDLRYFSFFFFFYYLLLYLLNSYGEEGFSKFTKYILEILKTFYHKKNLWNRVAFLTVTMRKIFNIFSKIFGNL